MADAGLDKAERGHMSVKLAMGDPATSFEEGDDERHGSDLPRGSAPSTSSVVSYASFRIYIQDQLMLFEPGRLFYSVAPRGMDSKIHKMLQPVFSHIHREDHSERSALLHIARTVLKRCGSQASDDCSGWLRLYVSHFPCISCVAVICQAEANTWKHMCFTRSELRGLTQFIRFFPAIRLELDFDNMWKTRFEEMAGAMRFEREGGLAGAPPK
ncbi:unnamed protein product [Durusdinium trenchii]|uniref:CMP/dCMP-type deaminase domain-containing protein n=1 Tax=Durusdinium trenchii TaxID=1381693 RepID=A0ABP0S978_9DINO